MKIKLFILRQKYRIKSQKDDQGGSLVMSMMLGFTLMTLSTVILANSSNLQINTKANKSTRQGKAIAERVVTRFQDLISQNPEIATYPDCATSRDSNGQCQDSTTDDSWFRAGNILPSSDFCTDSNTRATNISNKASNQSWYDINPSNTKEGQYRLISYNYGPTVGVAPGTATITIEARINQPDTNNSTTSRMEVSMPVVDNSNINVGTNGLWINSNSTSDISGGSSEIRANIKDSTCSANTDTTRVDKLKSYQQAPQMTDGNSYAYDSTPGKPFPDLPAEGQTVPGTGINTFSVIDSTISLPQVGDTEVNNTFIYNVTETGDAINLSSGETLTIDAGADKTVVIYLHGDLHLSGGSIVVNNGTRLIVYSHDDLDIKGTIQNNNSTADYAQFYQYTSDDHIIIDSSTVTNAFIFAPYTYVDLKGGSVLNGTVWTKKWKVSADSIFTQGNTNLANIKELQLFKPMITGVTSWSKNNSQ